MPRSRVAKSADRLSALVILAFFLVAPAAAAPSWVVRYDGPDGLADEGTALAITPGGDLLVLGSSVEDTGSLQVPRLLLVEYGPDGTPLWQRRLGSPLPGFDSVVPKAVAVDAAGRITAIATVNPFHAVMVVQVDPDGQTRWTETFTDSEAVNITAQDVAADADGNVYATGDAYTSSGSEPGLTVRYSPDGLAAPPIRYEGPLGYAAPRASAVTSAGELALAGSTAYAGLGGQFSVVLFDGNGQVVWEYATGGDGSATVDLAYDVVMVGTDVVATGYVDGNTATEEDVWTVRLDQAGQVVWSHRYSTAAQGADIATRVAADELGNVFAAGSAEVGFNDYDALVLKYDELGNLAWARTYAGAAEGFETARAIAADGEGGAWAAGSIEIATGVSAYFALHYDADGNLLSEEVYPGPMGGGSKAFDLVADAAGAVYVTGRSLGDTDYDVATLKLSGTLFADGFESGDTGSWTSVMQ